MSGDHTDPRTTVDRLEGDPLGSTEPTWRDDHTDVQVGTTEEDAPDHDPERTIDADPAWRTELRAEPNEQAADRDDAERTTDADADLVEHVRAAARAARSGLAAPPTARTEEAVEAAAAPAEEAAHEPPTETGIDPALPPAPADVAAAMPPPLAEPAADLPPPTSDTPHWAPVAAAPSSAAAAVTTTDASTATTTATGAGAATAASGRWQPPARLRPAELRAATPLIADRTPKRHLDWRWAVVGVVAAAVIGFLIAIAVSGDDAPDPAPGSTTVPGASTTVSTP